MATLGKVKCINAYISTFCKIFSEVSLNKSSHSNVAHKAILTSSLQRFYSSSSPSSTTEKLMQFFDDEKNWGENEVKVGRSWLKDELRIKSNSDLHKLWYVLLKERNMLLTMEHESKERFMLFPSPERIDKVNESMENLESVVRERNKAYHLLETGETGERQQKQITNPLGIRHNYKLVEHIVPIFMNAKWKKKYQFYYEGTAVKKFLRFYREKLFLSKRRAATRDFNHVIGLLKRFPNMDLEAVKQEYPSVDIEKAKASRKCRGHWIPK